MMLMRATLGGLLATILVGSCGTKPSPVKTAHNKAAPVPTVETPNPPAAATKPTGTTVIIRQRETHGFLLGWVEGESSISVVPNGSDLVPEGTTTTVQSYITAPTPLTSIGIFKKDFVQVKEATGRTRVECGHVLAELRGETNGELFAVASHALHPRDVREVAATPSHWALLAKSVRTAKAPATAPKKDYQVAEMNVYEVDLDGDGTTETIQVAIGELFQTEATFDYSVLAVSSGDSAPVVVGYQKPTDPEAYDSSESTDLLGIADLNGDGKMEVLVLFDSEWGHYERLAVYTWDGTLKPLMTYAWPEDDCYPELSKWPN